MTSCSAINIKNCLICILLIACCLNINRALKIHLIKKSFYDGALFQIDRLLKSNYVHDGSYHISCAFEGLSTNTIQSTRTRNLMPPKTEGGGGIRRAPPGIMTFLELITKLRHIMLMSE